MNNLNNQNEQRPVILGEYITANKATVRATAKYFGISKSTVHKDVSKGNGILNRFRFFNMQILIIRIIYDILR